MEHLLAVTHVTAVQAPKRAMQEPTCREWEKADVNEMGRVIEFHRFCRGIDGGMRANGYQGQHRKPQRGSGDDLRAARAGTS